MVVDHGIPDHDLRKDIRIIASLMFLLSVIFFNMMKVLAKVKAGKTVTKKSYKVINRLSCIRLHNYYHTTKINS